MKNYTITVNGNVYDVTVEEGASTGAAGKVFKLDTKVGDTVKKGDAVITIEAMKMEIPQVAPQDGVVASINVAVGDACEAGKVLATLK